MDNNVKNIIIKALKDAGYDICNSKGYGIIAMETDKDHIHFLISYHTKVYREPRLMATNLQGSFHRPGGSGFPPTTTERIIFMKRNLIQCSQDDGYF